MALYCFQNTVYPSYRAEVSNNLYPSHHIVVVVWDFFVCFLCSFAGFEGEREEKKDPELQGFHPQHAKAIRRNAWIFHDDSDACHSKKRHFMVISHPWEDTL